MIVMNEERKLLYLFHILKMYMLNNNSLLEFVQIFQWQYCYTPSQTKGTVFVQTIICVISETYQCTKSDIFSSALLGVWGMRNGEKRKFNPILVPGSTKASPY